MGESEWLTGPAEKRLLALLTVATSLGFRSLGFWVPWPGRAKAKGFEAGVAEGMKGGGHEEGPPGHVHTGNTVESGADFRV